MRLRSLVPGKKPSLKRLVWAFVFLALIGGGAYPSRLGKSPEALFPQRDLASIRAEVLPFHRLATQPSLMAIDRLIDDEVLRGEEVEVRFERLAPVRTEGYRLILNLFSDTRLIAQMNAPSLLGVREMLLSGYVEGDPQSRVELDVHDGLVAGRIKTSQGRYKIFSVPDQSRIRTFIVELKVR